MRRRSWTLTALFLALPATLACGRTGLGTSQQGTGGSHGASGADTGGATASTGGAAGAVSWPCGEATCLSSLFQTCVPAGSCAQQGAGGPSATALRACYANGVTVSYVGGWNGTNVTTTLTVSRQGAPCYAIQSVSGTTESATRFVISGPSGEVATAVTADKAGSISVTCHGREPVLVDHTCLAPVSTSPDHCDPGTCP
jgi:hypothetical protein